MHNPLKMLPTFRSTAIALTALTLASCSFLTSSAEKPEDRLLAAAAHAQLDAPGLPPWHLKLDVTVYDSRGDNPISGTIERWNSAHGDRTVYTFGDAKRALLNDGDQHYTSHSGPEVPALVDGVLETVLRPGPSESEIKGSNPEAEKEYFGKVQLDCVMLSEPTLSKGPIALGLFPTYCMDPDRPVLRASFNFGTFTVLRNDITIFQGLDVAHRLVFIQGTKTRVAEAKISTLETFTPSPTEFAPNDSMKPYSAMAAARVAGSVMAGHILKRLTPAYPVSERQAHISGTVILRAIIGRDGQIRYLRPVSSPDTGLAVAAIDSVRQWTYTPYLLNGEPTDVDTTITVNFNLNPF